MSDYAPIRLGPISSQTRTVDGQTVRDTVNLYLPLDHLLLASETFDTSGMTATIDTASRDTIEILSSAVLTADATAADGRKAIAYKGVRLTVKTKQTADATCTGSVSIRKAVSGHYQTQSFAIAVVERL